MDEKLVKTLNNAFWGCEVSSKGCKIFPSTTTWSLEINTVENPSVEDITSELQNVIEYCNALINELDI